MEKHINEHVSNKEKRKTFVINKTSLSVLICSQQRCVYKSKSGKKDEQKGGVCVQKERGMKDRGSRADIKREMDGREHKSKDSKKSKERCERGGRVKKKKKFEGDQHGEQLGGCHRGSSSGSSRRVKVILSSHLLEVQQPKLCSDLTFQKAQVDPTFMPLFFTTLLFLPLTASFPSAPFSSFSLIPVTTPPLLCSCMDAILFSITLL